MKQAIMLIIATPIALIITALGIQVNEVAICTLFISLTILFSTSIRNFIALENGLKEVLNPKFRKKIRKSIRKSMDSIINVFIGSALFFFLSMWCPNIHILHITFDFGMIAIFYLVVSIAYTIYNIHSVHGLRMDIEDNIANEKD